MSRNAKDVGLRVLQDVQMVGFDEVLHSIRSARANSQPKQAFNIPSLDRLLPPHTSAAQGDKTSINHPSSGFYAELTSDNPSDGKTSLLYLIAAYAVLPPSLGHVALHGQHAAVVVLDADNRFDVAALACTIRGHVDCCVAAPQPKASGAGGNGLDWTTPQNLGLLRSALDHVHVFRPRSMEALVATVKYLPRYLAEIGSKGTSKQRRLHSIMLDSAGAFYWQSKAADENRRMASGATAPIPASEERNQLREEDGSSRKHAESEASPAPAPGQRSELASLLRTLAARFEANLICTTWPISALSSSTSQTLPSSNPSFPTLPSLRLHISRVAVPPFPPTMAVEEAMRQRGLRQIAVERNKFIVHNGTATAGFVVGPDGGLRCVD